jgi:hypothetical protein
MSSTSNGIPPIKAVADEDRYYLIEFEVDGDDVCLLVTQYESDQPEGLSSMAPDWARRLAEGLINAAYIADKFSADVVAAANGTAEEARDPDEPYKGVTDPLAMLVKGGYLEVKVSHSATFNSERDVVAKSLLDGYVGADGTFNLERYLEDQAIF